MKNIFNVRVSSKILVGIIFGVVVGFTIHLAYAQIANNTIYACASNATGSLRIVSSSATCKSSETSISWNVQGPVGPQGPQGPAAPSLSSSYMCPGCNFTGDGLVSNVPKFFSGKDLNSAYIPFIDLGYANVDLSNTNFTGATIIGAHLQGVQASGANFSNAQLHSTTFSSAVLTNANFSGANVQAVDFSNTNLSNANFTNADLSDFTLPSTAGSGTYSVNFTNANLTGAIFTGATVSANITWSNTICPNGTNSNNNNSTCTGQGGGL